MKEAKFKSIKREGVQDASNDVSSCREAHRSKVIWKK